jgi:hypothetical protein
MINVMVGRGGGGTVSKAGGHSGRSHHSSGRVTLTAIITTQSKRLIFNIFIGYRLATPSGLTSIPAGLETPEMIQLRSVVY